MRRQADNAGTLQELISMFHTPPFVFASSPCNIMVTRSVRGPEIT